MTRIGVEGAISWYSATYFEMCLGKPPSQVQSTISSEALESDGWYKIVSSLILVSEVDVDMVDMLRRTDLELALTTAWLLYIYRRDLIIRTLNGGEEIIKGPKILQQGSMRCRYSYNPK
jgi:hypothetical protein